MYSEVLCSAAARDVQDDPAGSATDFSSFLLLTDRRAWGRQAAEAAAAHLLTPEAARLVTGSTNGLRSFAIRPVGKGRADEAIGAPGNRSDGGEAEVGGPHYLGTVGGTMRRLTTPPDAATLGLLDTGNVPEVGEAIADPLVAVCTNGSRDRCCAIVGRPIALGLAATFGSTVTEISHLGGHRFAGTLVVLPWGYAYGFTDAGDAELITRQALEGLVRPQGLRGRVGLPPAAQAAESHWRQAIGPAEPAAVTIDTALAAADGTWTVRGVVAGSAETLTLRYQDGPTVGETLCGGKPFGTGRWTFPG